MTASDNPDLRAAHHEFFQHGARVLADAARKIAQRPLTTDEYQDLADACSALTIMLTTHLEAIQRTTLIIPKRTDP